MNIFLPFSDLLPCGVCSFSDLADNLINCRAKSRLPEKSKSVIVYLFPYYLGKEFYKDSNISKYSVSEDYHNIVGEYLGKAMVELQKNYPDYNFQWFCDNSPIPEVTAAVNAGLGVKGLNGLLINEQYGSFCFIGEIVTDMEITPSLYKNGTCLNCQKCINMCAGKALGGIFSKDKCLSHITQKKGVLEAWEQELIKANGCAWGCDVCQDVCPMNNDVKITPVTEFIKSAKPVFIKGDSVEGRAFSWRGPQVIERNLAIICCKDK